MEDVTSVRKTARRLGTGVKVLSETWLLEESEEFFVTYTVKIFGNFKVTAARLMKILCDAVNTRCGFHRVKLSAKTFACRLQQTGRQTKVINFCVA